jgi:hypothetical protein
MRSRVRSTRENRRFSFVEKRPEDFFHGQLAGFGKRQDAYRLTSPRWDRWPPARRFTQKAGHEPEGPGPSRTPPRLPRPLARGTGKICCKRGYQLSPQASPIYQHRLRQHGLRNFRCFRPLRRPKSHGSRLPTTPANSPSFPSAAATSWPDNAECPPLETAIHAGDAPGMKSARA